GRLHDDPPPAQGRTRLLRPAGRGERPGRLPLHMAARARGGAAGERPAPRGPAARALSHAGGRAAADAAGAEATGDYADVIAATRPRATATALRRNPDRVAFALVATALFVLVAGANLATPLYAVYRERFGFSSVVLTLVFATYQLVLCPALVIFGQLSDGIGRRPVVA